MGFLARRRAAKFMEELDAVGEMADEHAALPLRDHALQELRVAVEARLEEGWVMPGFWAQVGLDYTNAREDVEDEEDGWAFTDALVLGYALREVESQRPDARAIPSEIAERLAAAPPDSLQEAARQTAADLAAGGPVGLFALGAEAWDDFEFWARQYNTMRSRGRRREAYEAADIDYVAPLPSAVDYEVALAFGYALCCCAEVSDFDDIEPEIPAESAAPSALPAFEPLDPPEGDAGAASEDLLVRTEGIFVGIRAPSRLGVALTAPALAVLGMEEGHPQYGGAIGAALFGYALRMAQAKQAPLPAPEVDTVEGWLPRTDDGALDYERMAEDPGALHCLFDHAASIADDEMLILELLRVPLEVWDQFAALAAEQLRRNLRRNGLARRYLLQPEGIADLIRIGCATRVIDEVAGEAPLSLPS